VTVGVTVPQVAAPVSLPDIAVTIIVNVTAAAA
jgi:hypothetical protein